MAHDPYSPRPRRAPEHNQRRREPEAPIAPPSTTGIPASIGDRLRAAGATDADLAGLWLRWKDSDDPGRERMTATFETFTDNDVARFLDGWRHVAVDIITSNLDLDEAADVAMSAAGPQDDPGGQEGAEATDVAQGADGQEENTQAPPPAEEESGVPDTIPDGHVRVDVSVSVDENTGYGFVADVPTDAGAAVAFLEQGDTIYGSQAQGDPDFLADERAAAVLTAEAKRAPSARRATVVAALEGCLGAEAVATALG